MVNEYKKDIETLLKQTDDIDFQIRRLRDDNKKLTVENDKKITEFQENLTKVEFQIKDALTKSEEDGIKVKCGWAHWRHLKDKIVIKDEKKAIEEFKKKLPSFVEKLIKITESIRKDSLNKLLEAGEIRIEILDFVTKEHQEKKFEYKFTGE